VCPVCAGAVAGVAHALRAAGEQAAIADLKKWVSQVRAHRQISLQVLYCAKKAGVTHVLRAGGAQAVAAMAWGTETCPKVGETANCHLPQTSEGACIYHTTLAELK